MKILVCISKVPDTTTKINFIDNNTRFNNDKVQFIINPYDEWYALVRAIELKEKQGGSVTVINVGTAENDQIIRKALAIGADDAIRVNIEPDDTYTTGRQIAQQASEGGFDMILTGKETINYNGSSLGGMIAAMLDWPFISYVSNLDMDNGTAILTRELEGGEEICEIQGNFVASAQKGMAEARIPNMRGIMMARSKPLKVIDPLEIAPLTGIVKYEIPPEKSGCKYIDAENPGELIDLLHNEAKVI